MEKLNLYDVVSISNQLTRFAGRYKWALAYTTPCKCSYKELDDQLNSLNAKAKDYGFMFNLVYQELIRREDCIDKMKAILLWPAKETKIDLWKAIQRRISMRALEMEEEDTVQTRFYIPQGKQKTFRYFLDFEPNNTIPNE